MDVEIKWLKDFVAIAQTRNFSKAAQVRHVTQPAFSRRIQQLEQHLGCKLINRRYQPIKLTEQGELVFESATRILDELNRLPNLINPSHQSKVSFAATHTLSLGVFPTVAQQLNLLTNPVEADLNVADADDCVSLLTQRQCDLLLAFHDPLLDNFHDFSILLGKVPLVPVCRPDSYGNPVYNLEGKSRSIPYLAYKQNIYLGRVVSELLNKTHLSHAVNKKFEAPMADSLKMMAKKGLGVAWIPLFSVEHELQTQQLVLAGGEAWQPELEVRLYKHSKNARLPEGLWELMEQLSI